MSDTANLVWTERCDVHNPNGISAGNPLHFKEFVAYSSGIIVSDVITVTLASSGNAAMVAVAVKNAFSPIPFDPYALSVNWANTATSLTDTINVADPTTIALGMFGWVGGSGSTFTAGAGYTTSATVNQSTNIGCAIEFQVLQAAQTALVVNGTLSVAENFAQISDALMAIGENVMLINMSSNQEGTIHNIYFNNTIGLPGHSAAVIAKADAQGDSQVFYNPATNGALLDLHIHITNTTSTILIVNTSTTDQLQVAWDGLRNI